MLIRSIVFAALLMVFAVSARADSQPLRQANAVDIVVDAWSEHLSGGEFNEHHEALGVEWTVESGGRWRTLLAAGQFSTSYRTEAWYAGAGWMRRVYRRGPVALEAGAHIGLAQSDGYYDGAVFPYFMPAATAHVGPMSVNLLFIPPVNDNGSVLSLQLKFVVFGGGIRR